MEQLQILKSYFATNLPAILEWVLIFLAYFFVALYKSKVNGAKQNLGTLFKETTERIDTANFKERTEMQKELAESKEKYAAAVSKIADLEDRVLRTEKVLHALIEEGTTDA